MQKGNPRPVEVICYQDWSAATFTNSAILKLREKLTAMKKIKFFKTTQTGKRQ